MGLIPTRACLHFLTEVRVVVTLGASSTVTPCVELCITEGTLTVSGVSIKPDFASIARGWSFYGTVASADEDQSFLEAQALSDPDVVNRYFAFRYQYSVGRVCTGSTPLMTLNSQDDREHGEGCHRPRVGQWCRCASCKPHLRGPVLQDFVRRHDHTLIAGADPRGIRLVIRAPSGPDVPLPGHPCGQVCAAAGGRTHHAHRFTHQIAAF